MKPKPSFILATVTWVSLFILSWLMILEVVETKPTNGIWLAFFLVIATIASAVYTQKGS